MSKINEFFAKKNIQGILALVIILSGLYILAYKDKDKDVIIAIVGLMSTVIVYYFKITKRTVSKDKTIANILEQKEKKEQNEII